MIFVFDLDDTICDSDGYSKKYIKQFFESHNMPYKQICRTARFAERYFDWSSQTALDWYKKYGDQMMLEFPCKKGVKETLLKLYNNGHKIIIATARANDWHIDPENITKKWLKDNDIPYHKIYVGRIDKEKICEEEDADVFVDDDLDTTARVAKHFETTIGKKFVFLSSTSYNKDLSLPNNVIRLNNFNKIKMLISDKTKK